MFYEIRYSTSSIVNDPARLLREISADVFTLNDGYEKVVIAKAKFYSADIEGALSEGMTPYSLLDIYSETFAFLDPFYGSDGQEIKDSVLDKLGCKGFNTDNLFIVAQLEVLPGYRKQGLSEIMINDAVRIFSGDADIIALLPFPLQNADELALVQHKAWYDQMDLKSLPSDENATEKLKSFYETLGFIDLKCDGFMAKVKEYY